MMHTMTANPCYCNACIGAAPRLTAEVCEVCNRTAVPRRHPCRFEKCCTCWYGVPCNGSGRVERRRARRAERTAPHEEVKA